MPSNSSEEGCAARALDGALDRGLGVTCDDASPLGAKNAGIRELDPARGADLATRFIAKYGLSVAASSGGGAGGRRGGEEIGRKEGRGVGESGENSNVRGADDMLIVRMHRRGERVVCGGERSTIDRS